MKEWAIKKSIQYEQWFQEWIKAPATITAFNLFNQIGGSDSDIEITKYRIIRTCFNAFSYNPETDPGQIYRTRIQTEKKKIDQLARSARLLAQSAKRNDKALMWACSKAEITSGVRLTRKEKPSPMAHNFVVENYFLNLENALRGRLPELDGGPFLHRFTVGNLIYEKPIKAGKPVNTETMLAFELAIYLRMHTANRANDSAQCGGAMPKDGEPCFPVVASFCAAVFGGNFTDKDIQDAAKRIGDNVRDLKNVGLNDWPQGG